MELRGLDSNDFLIDYFISATLNNTNGIKLDVDNFLDTNLNTILNDQRNSQLSQHAMVRYFPFLLNNTATSYYSNPIPYTQNTAYLFELQNDLDNMKAAQILSDEELLNKNNNTITSSTSKSK